MSEPFDLCIIGGGINGVGIARDAAGRGLSVFLAEKDDLGEGTSSRSGKLIHGGLRYLEYYEFRLVREALIEREVLLALAPHIIWPLRFVLPHSPEQRPVWMIRLGLFLYDHLGGRKVLPGSRRVDLTAAEPGTALRPSFRVGFEYSDCWVDDARLVVLNALDAARRGAVIRPRTRVVQAMRRDGLWRVRLAAPDGSESEIAARILVNAAGPWVGDVLSGVIGVNSRRRVRLVKGSHIVLRKFWEGDHAYLLQNHDRRVIFVNPYEEDFALVGTTDIPYEGDPRKVAIDAAERGYLLDVLRRYFRRDFAETDILAEFSGVRPLYDDEKDNPSAVTRDYVLDLDDGPPPLLSIFGGKITTYRKLAEHALERLARFLPPSARQKWTAEAPLPGGDIPGGVHGLASFREALIRRYPGLPAPLLGHYARRYGTRALEMLDGARTPADLGRHFGGELYAREADYLIATEWAETADDILERRTKHALRLTPTERASFEAWLAAR